MATLQSIESLPDLPVVDGVRFLLVPEFTGYAVGDDGSVWTKRTRWPDGKWHRMKTKTDKDGYLDVGLNYGGKQYTFQVHVLVLMLFVGPRPDGMVARHFPDRDRSNNRANNLQWSTQKDNLGDREVHGTLRYGAKHHCAKLTQEQALEIWNLKGKMANKEIALRFGVSNSTVSAIHTKRYWWKALQNAISS